MKPAQHFEDVAGETVCHTEDAVKSDFPVDYMVGQKRFKFVKGIRVIQYFHLVGQAAGKTPCLKTGFSLVGFVDERGTGSQKSHVFTAKVSQLLGGELPAGEAGDTRPHGAVDGDKGGVFFYNQPGIVGQADNTVNLVVLRHQNIFLLLLRIEIGGAQQHTVFSF